MLKIANSAKESGACSDKGKSAGLWKLVWKLNCPNKIKHFYGGHVRIFYRQISA